METRGSGKTKQPTNTPTGTRPASFSGYTLFTEEFFSHKEKKQKGKVKDKEKTKVNKVHNFQKSNLEVREAWNGLSEEQRKEYGKRAEKLRGPSKGKMYVVPFLTRCAPKQFMAVCKNLKSRPDAMKRLKNIGFDKLVHICCPQINRHICAEFMRCFDPPTNQISFRGQTRELKPKDVHQLLGLPNGGVDIQVHVNEEDRIFKDLRSVYRNLKYQQIGDLLTGALDENFEFLFVIFALGTLLSPSASIYVSDRVLKLMTLTKDALGDFNWSSFILNELCAAIGDFQKELRKGNTKCRKTVGGCIYFLMMFCLQHFPLANLKASKDEDAILYWNEERVRSRVQLEKSSKKGLLYGAGQGDGPSSTLSHPETMLTHPELKRTYTRLVSIIGNELLALQNRLLHGNNNEVDDENDDEDEDEEEDATIHKPSTSTIFEKDDDKPAEEEENEDDKEEDAYTQGEEDESESEDKGPDDKDDDKDDEHHEAIIEIDAHDGGEPSKEELQQHELGENQQEGSYVEVRRSNRIITPSWVVKSPWIDGTRKSKGKRKVDDKDSLFQLCTTRCSDKEGDEEFVAMHDDFLTRRELQCLRPRAWINDRLMTMVAKTFIADQQQKEGRVTRHIFTADFTRKLVANPFKWSLPEHETQILPKYVGYNIGDCDFIFAPCVWQDHWFCYVVDTKAMHCYALDSLVDIRTYGRRQRELEEGCKPIEPKKKRGKRKGEIDPKDHMAQAVRNCLFQMLQRVKPELFVDENKVQPGFTWAKVHVQHDTDSCGVHVLSWLQMWDGNEQGEDGYTMPYYTAEELHEMKVGFLWWLVTHPLNKHVDKVMSLVQGMHKRTRPN